MKYPEWLLSAIRTMAGFLELENGWDSYNGKMVSSKAVLNMLDLLHLTLERHTPEPDIVPIPAGGVQLEWHVAGYDVEVSTLGEEVECFVERPNGAEEEFKGTSFSVHEKLSGILQELTSATDQPPQERSS